MSYESAKEKIPASSSMNTYRTMDEDDDEDESADATDGTK